MGDPKKRRGARLKYEVFLETRQKDANIGEILRRHGMHTSDLRRIETRVEEAALEALKFRNQWNSRKDEHSKNSKAYQELERELARKEKAFADLMVEHTLLKKSERSAWKGRWNESTSAENGGRG